MFIKRDVRWSRERFLNYSIINIMKIENMSESYFITFLNTFYYILTLILLLSYYDSYYSYMIHINHIIMIPLKLIQCTCV